MKIVFSVRNGARRLVHKTADGSIVWKNDRKTTDKTSRNAKLETVVMTS